MRGRRGCVASGLDAGLSEVRGRVLLWVCVRIWACGWVEYAAVVVGLVP